MKVQRNLKMTWWEKAYLPEVFHGLFVTSRHLFHHLFGFLRIPFSRNKQRTIFTVYYPEERVHLPSAYRGRPALVVDENGVERCVACGLCEKYCPAECIAIQPAETEADKERYPETFTIDLSRCIMCGFCEEVCPKNAIIMSDEFELATYDRSELIYNKEQLQMSVKDLEKQLNYIRQAYNDKPIQS